MKVNVREVELSDVRDVAVMTGEYQAEMIAQTGVAGSGFSLQEKELVLRDFLDNTDYAVLIARSVRGHPLGYVTVFESRPYFGDPVGFVEQVYVRAFYRRRRIARRLVAAIRELALKKRWRRLMVMFPSDFRPGAALSFFEKQGFADSGGRKQWLKV